MQASRKRRYFQALACLWMIGWLAVSGCAATSRTARREIEDLPGGFTYSRGQTAHIDLFRQAGEHLSDHQFTDAEATYRQLTLLEPENEAAYIGLGSSLFYQDRLDEAWEAYLQAADLAPESSEAYVGLGSVALRRGDLNAAHDYYSRSLGLDEGSPDAHWGLAIVLARQGHPSAAIVHLDRVVELAPGSNLADLAQAMIEDLQAGSGP